MTKVTAIILHWNNAEDTLGCIASLQKQTYPNCDILIVDNGSTDDSTEIIRTHHPEIALLQTGRNLGYTGGNNAGIVAALQTAPDFIWLLNDDVVVAPDALDHLIIAASENPQAVFLGPLVVTRENPNEILSAGGFQNRRFEPHYRKLGEPVDSADSDTLTVDYVSGCALLVRCSALASLGLLDEAFFAYMEDIEWCLRVRPNHSVLLVPQAHVSHPDTRLRDKTAGAVAYYITRNHLLLMKKQRAGLHLQMQVFARFLLWVVNWSLNPKWRGAEEKRNAVARAMRDYIFGRFGKSRDY